MFVSACLPASMKEEDIKRKSDKWSSSSVDVKKETEERKEKERRVKKREKYSTTNHIHQIIKMLLCNVY